MLLSRPLLPLIGIVALTALTATGCTEARAQAPASAPGAEPVKVRTTPVTRRIIASPIRATGVVTPKEQATLSFKVGGVVARVLVQPGDHVHPGQILAALDLSELDAQLEQATLSLEKAQRDSTRAHKLLAGQATTQQQADDADSALHLAEQNVAIVRFNREHATLVSSGTGRVVRRLVEPNAVVAPGTAILQVNMAASGYVVRAGLIDRDVVRLDRNAKAQVTIDAYPDRQFAAHVTEIAEEPSALSGVYDVELRLDQPPPRLLSGLIAKVEIQPQDAQQLAVIPIEALVDGDGQSGSVYAVAPDGHAHKTPIRMAFLMGSEVAVRSGLDGVARVVAGGAAYLTDGAAVREVAP